MLALLWGVDVGDLNAFSLGARWWIGALLVGLPVGLAGVLPAVNGYRTDVAENLVPHP